MADELKGMRIALLATDGVEQIELVQPRAALIEAGAQTDLVAPSPGGSSIQAFNHHDKGDRMTVDREVAEVDPGDYDALVLPGGVINPDILRTKADVIAFVSGFIQGGKPVAAICHGPWTLIDAGGVAGRRMTSWPSLRVDLENAGATWVDEEVVTDRGLVTSRRPDDLPAFCRAMILAFAGSRGAAT